MLNTGAGAVAGCVGDGIHKAVVERGVGEPVRESAWDGPRVSAWRV
jgi:hypothetical protein